MQQDSASSPATASSCGEDQRPSTPTRPLGRSFKRSSSGLEFRRMPIQIFPFREREAIQEMLQVGGPDRSDHSERWGRTDPIRDRSFKDSRSLSITKGSVTSLSMRAPIRKWQPASASMPKCRSQRSAMPWKPCWSMRKWQTVSFHQLPEALQREGVELRGCPRTLRDPVRDQGGDGGRLVPGILRPHPFRQGGEWNRGSHEAYCRLTDPPTQRRS